MEFIREHIALKNPKVLYESVICTAAKLMNEKHHSVEESTYEACILNAFPFAGKDTLSKEEIIQTADEILKTCKEYAKDHQDDIMKWILNMDF